MARYRGTSSTDIHDVDAAFDDPRLEHLVFLYRARQLPKSLLADERSAYDEYINEKLFAGEPDSQFSRFIAKVTELARTNDLDADKRYVLEELALYAQSLLP
jgi:exodeoxyribonuclease I